MGQFWGLSIGDDARVECVLRKYGSHIAQCTQSMGSFGVGYYSRGELLQTVEPRNENEEFDIEKVIKGVRSDLIVMHARNPGPDAIRREDIHPFRFKDWLFAHTGKVVGFDSMRERLSAAMPAFILRNIRGKTDSEYLFHLFLAFLYDAGDINRTDLDTNRIADALVRAFSTIDEFASVAGHPPSPAAVIVANGYSVVAGARDLPLAYAVIDGIEDCSVCRISALPGDRSGHRVHHEDVRAALIYSCGEEPVSPPFVPLEGGKILMVDKYQAVSIRSLR